MQMHIHYQKALDIDYMLIIKVALLKTKNFRNYYLENFNITANIIDNKFKFNTLTKNIQKKIFKKN